VARAKGAVASRAPDGASMQLAVMRRVRSRLFENSGGDVEREGMCARRAIAKVRMHAGACVCLWLALMSGVCATASPATASGVRDPRSSPTLGEATVAACQEAPDGPACRIALLGAINEARAGERVRPMRLPADFAALSVGEQLFVVANVERVDRGLSRITGMSRDLDRSALRGARKRDDPTPDPFYGTSFGSNWAGGLSSALEADFMWMYDDGPGSSNIDCPGPGFPGCWGHRHNILAAYQSPLMMGAAADGTSITELFVGGDSRRGQRSIEMIS